MKKTLIYLAAAAMFTACSSDIDYTEPDNITDEITFSVGNIGMPSKIASRAGDHEHNPWNADVHANTLGVFGFCEGATIFDNQKVTYNSTGNKWEYSPKKYWQEYADKTSFDFFGYMVEDAELPSATLTPSGSSYTLSFPASIETPILTSADNTPLICHAPVHTSFQKLAIPFQMDQALTGYCLQFQLGEKMDNIRDFVITSVKVYGNNLPVSGTVSRTYTLNGSNWTAGDVAWTDVTTSSVSADKAVSVPISLNPSQVTVNTHTDWVKWGGSELTDGAFYIIPSATFTPTIEVTYDVVANDDNNDDGSTITRKDVKSKIILNTTNFKDLATGKTGEIHPIRIKIVPDYLYVLSDDDHATGVLVVGK